MRSKEEVQSEIDWREETLKEIRLDLEKDSISEEQKKYLRGRITSLSFAMEWCKWFLYEK